MAKYGVEPKPYKELGPTAKFYRNATKAQKDKHLASSAKANKKSVAKRSATNAARESLKIKDPHVNAGHKRGGGFEAVPDKKNKAANGSGKRSRYHA